MLRRGCGAELEPLSFEIWLQERHLEHMDTGCIGAFGDSLFCCLRASRCCGFVCLAAAIITWALCDNRSELTAMQTPTDAEHDQH